MQGEPKLTKVEVNDVDVTSYLKSWQVKDTEGDDYITTASVLIDKSSSAVLDLISSNLSTKFVTIWRGVSSATETKVFTGEITNFIPKGGNIELKCSDKLHILQRKTLTKSYDSVIDDEAGVISEIFKDLINNYTDSELQADDSSVTNSGTSLTIKKFVCRDDTVYNKCKELADALGWIFFYKATDNKVYFQPKATTNQSTTIQNGVNLVNIPKWDHDSTEIVNQIKAKGAVQNVETTVTGQIGVTTGFSTTDVELRYAPLSAKVYSDASNPPTTLRKGGKDSVSTTYDYSIDQEKKKVEWNKDTYTPNTDDYVQINYTYGLPTPVKVINSDSQDKYRIKKKVIQLKNIKDVDDAYIFAQQQLDNYGEPLISAKIEVIDISDLEVGQQVKVIDTSSNIEETLIINSVEMNYPYNKDTIRLGSYIKKAENLLFNIIKKIKSLEEENLSDEELLSHYYSGTNTIKFENRFFELYNNQNSLILDHATRGILDGSNVFAGGTTDEYLVIRYPGESDTFKEYVYDNRFYNTSSSSGVTWNSTTETITISTTGYLQTNYVSKGISYNDYKLNIGSSNGGNLTWKVRGANSVTWQTPTLNTWTTFTGTCDEVVIKCENSGTTSNITNTYNSKDEYENPSIKLELRNGD